MSTTVQPSLEVLMAGYVRRQAEAAALGLAAEPGAEVTPYEAGPVQPIDPKLAETLIPSGSAVCDTNFVLDYFRPTLDHRMLYGGRVSYSTATPMNLAASMQRRMARSFPQLKNTKVEYAWGGFVDISMNRAPDFGRLAERLHGADRADWANVYYLQGFSGHGLALTGLAGKLVAEAIAGDAERFDTFARIRHRPFPGGKLLRTPALVGDWTDHERAVVDAVDELCAHDKISQDTWIALTTTWAEPELVELTLLVGYYRMLAGLMNSVEVELDEGVPGWTG